MTFKSGDIIKMSDDAHTGANFAQTVCFKYIVLGVGKYPGYVKTYCIKGPKRWVGNTYNFNADTMEMAE